jgi:hypothetical protein
MIFNNQQAHILKKQFMLHIILLERIFLVAKKLTIALLDGFYLSLVSYLSTFPFNGLFISSSNIFAIIKWFTFT